MSLIFGCDVECNDCHNWVEGMASGTGVSVRLARKNAREAGWIHKTIDGVPMDLCPDCAKARGVKTPTIAPRDTSMEYNSFIGAMVPKR